MGCSKLPFIVFGFTVLALLTLKKVSAADSISYVGAVVEYYPVINGRNGTTIAINNAKNYVRVIKTASNYNVDIIVFPESSLTAGLTPSGTNRTLYPSFSSIVPSPGTDIPCDNASTVVIEALRLISCAAKTYNMYVVVNLHEMENCSTTGTTTRPCPSDGYFFYNTNVVFNRTGGIVSRYRKFNLFGEPGFNVTATPEVATFKTDFNVTFGHFICFDIFFKTPSLTLVKDYNVTDILYPVRWFSELPYLTALQEQSAWSYANNVNLLAAGYNTPATGNGGSGIYVGTEGNLVTLWAESLKNALLVARVPKVINGARSQIIVSTEYPLIHEFSDTEIPDLPDIVTVGQQALFQDNLKPFTTTELSLTNGTTTTSVQLCDRELCCSFYINSTFSKEIADSSAGSYYRYRIAVFNGVRSFYGGKTGGEQICSVISCTDDTLASCGLRFSASETVMLPTFFNDIIISGKFSSSSNTMQSPNSLTTEIVPLNSSDFAFVRKDCSSSSVANISYNLIAGKNNILTFAIYGRNFSADGLKPTKASV